MNTTWKSGKSRQGSWWVWLLLFWAMLTLLLGIVWWQLPRIANVAVRHYWPEELGHLQADVRRLNESGLEVRSIEWSHEALGARMSADSLHVDYTFGGLRAQWVDQVRMERPHFYYNWQPEESGTEAEAPDEAAEAEELVVPAFDLPVGALQLRRGTWHVDTPWMEQKGTLAFELWQEAAGHRYDLKLTGNDWIMDLAGVMDAERANGSAEARVKIMLSQWISFFRTELALEIPPALDLSFPGTIELEAFPVWQDGQLAPMDWTLQWSDGEVFLEGLRIPLNIKAAGQLDLTEETVSMSGTLSWPESGGDIIFRADAGEDRAEGSVEVKLGNLWIDAAEAALNDIAGKVAMTWDGENIYMAEAETWHVGSVSSYGQTVENIAMRFRLINESTVEILEATFQWAGGKFSLEPFVVDLNTMDCEIRLKAEGLDMKVLSALFPDYKVAAEGLLDGHLGLSYVGGQVRPLPGYLVYREGTGGAVRYRNTGWLTGDTSGKAPGVSKGTRAAEEAFENLTLDKLEIFIHQPEQTRPVILKIAGTGYSPTMRLGVPVITDVNVNYDLEDLMTFPLLRLLEMRE